MAPTLRSNSLPSFRNTTVGLLINGCRNVGCMEANTGQSQSCISQHLMRLKAAGVVRAARAGNEVYYEVADPAAAAAATEPTKEDVVAAAKTLLAGGMPPSAAAKQTSADTPFSKGEIYKELIAKE